MRRPAPLLRTALSLLLPLLVAACGTGGRDAHDVAADFEGTVGSTTIDRVLRDVDLTHVPVTVSIENAPEQHFGADDQAALESQLHAVADAFAGQDARVTQQVVDDTGDATQRLTVTVALEHDGATQFVPMALDLVRDGRRVIISRVRVMASAH